MGIWAVAIEIMVEIETATVVATLSTVQEVARRFVGGNNSNNTNIKVNGTKIQI